MDPKKVKSPERQHRRTIHITVRVSPDVMRWLKEKRFSSTKIFHEAIRELGYKDGI